MALLSALSPRSKRNRSKSKKKSSVSIQKNAGSAPSTPLKRSSRSALRIQTNSHSPMASLGTGALSKDGSVSFVPSPAARSKIARTNLFSPSETSYEGIVVPTSTTSTVLTAKSRIIGTLCSYLRVSDLEMDDESVATMSVSSDSSMDPQEHSIRPVVNPPPGMESNPKERWVALCATYDNTENGESNNDPEHTPIAPLAIERLANFGLTTALNEGMWQPEGRSEKLLKKASGDSEWMKETFVTGFKATSTGSDLSSEILVWTGSFDHGFHGSEVPAIRAAGVVETSSKKLIELLVDSTRVKEYNKMSLGRQDLVTFGGNLEEEGPFGKSITKVMRSESKPPMMANIALTTVLNAKQLPDGSGHVIVSRTVHRPEKEGGDGAATEVVMGVNLVVDFDTDNGAERCIMINVNHMRSPGVPLYIARKIAVTTAQKFINDIRALV